MLHHNPFFLQARNLLGWRTIIKAHFTAYMPNEGTRKVSRWPEVKNATR